MLEAVNIMPQLEPVPAWPPLECCLVVIFPSPSMISTENKTLYLQLLKKKNLHNTLRKQFVLDAAGVIRVPGDLSDTAPAKLRCNYHDPRTAFPVVI